MSQCFAVSKMHREWVQGESRGAGCVWTRPAPFGFRQWLSRIVCAAVLSLAGLPLCPPGCGVAVVGLFVGILAVLVACWGPEDVLALPWLGVVLFVLQSVGAPIYAYWFPFADPYWAIGVNYPRVLAVASWGSLAFFAGIALPVVALWRAAPQATTVVSNRLIRWSLCTLLSGYILCLAGDYMPWSSLRFLLALLALLRFVAAGVLVMAPGGGLWRLAVVLGGEVYLSSRGAMMHDLALIWVMLLSLLALSHRWRWRFAFALVLLAPIFHIFQCSKVMYRESVWFGRGEHRGLVSIMLAVASSPGESFEQEKLGMTFARLNQGKIVEAILNHVPSVEPFASGKTIAEGFYAAMVPRVFDPGKPMGTDRQRFMRYTGHFLQPGVSMNLGILGEGYANFGAVGGVCVVFVYGLIFGVGLMFFHRRARRCPLWWVWFCYIFYWWPKTEGGIAASLNFATKAAVVFLGVRFVSASWRGALWVGADLARPVSSRRSELASPSAYTRIR